MRLPTAIGTVIFETEWAPLLYFAEARRTPYPALEEREIIVRVEVVDRAEIDQRTASAPPDAYPREVFIEGARFTLWRDRIEGRVPRDLVQSGLVIEWLWYALAVCCAPEGWECVHAAAVEQDRGVCLIFGESGQGKTRTAVDMLTSGWRFFADDVVLVDAEGKVARGWGNTLHVDPRTAQQLGHDSLTLDFCGKIQMPPPTKSVRNQAPIVMALVAGEKPRTIHEGPGYDSEWVNDYGAGARLLADAKPVQDNLDIRVAITNRNPWKLPTKWDGGDMTNALGYVRGLRALGVTADFVPWDELDEKDYDLIHLFHTQFDWSREVVKRTRKPLVVTAITQLSPETKDVAPVVKRAKAVLCYSRLEEEWYAERFPKQPREKFSTVPQGVDAGIYEGGRDVTPTFSVFMAGRYCPTKNQMAVLRACKQLGVPVTFAGMVDRESGSYLATLRKEVHIWKEARFFGMLKGEELWRRYRAAHVHVQPSTFESFGLCTWEALAAGCNVVAPARGFGRPFFEPHGTCTEPDQQAVLEAIQFELRQPRDRHKFRPPTWEQVSRNLIPVYREAMT